ncbi:MAG: dihydrolipoyl dehydrogenase [Peptococcaceae bacterium]
MKRITVLGGGPGGYTAAIRCAQNGAEVTLIEKDSLGGTCLNWGCIPTKSYIESVSSGGKELPQVKERKNNTVAQLVNGVNTLLVRNGVKFLQGEGRVISPRETEVIFPDHSSTIIPNDVLILANGSQSVNLPIPGFDLPQVLDSKGILELTELPGRLVIIGGGVIGLEFAQIFAGLGSKVTIVEMLPKMLATLDDELVRRLQPVIKKQGIDVFTGTRVTKILPGEGQLEVYITGKKDEILKADIVLAAAGRIPNLQGVDAAKLELALEGRFVKVNQFMETNLADVYALGDITKSPMLAHVAAYEAEIAVKNIFKATTPADYTAVPACVYTHPELAGVGISENEAKNQGINYKVGKFPFTANGRAMTQDAAYGMVKIIAEEKTGVILGAHILGPNASELIHELTLAVRWGMTVEQVAETIHAHPTLAEAVLEAAHGVFHKPIHSI